MSDVLSNENKWLQLLMAAILCHIHNNLGYENSPKMSRNKQNIAIYLKITRINTDSALTPSTPAVPNCCCSKGSAPYWSNPSFLIFDIWALWRSVLSARAPKCQKLKMVGYTSIAKCKAYGIGGERATFIYQIAADWPEWLLQWPRPGFQCGFQTGRLHNNQALQQHSKYSVI